MIRAALISGFVSACAANPVAIVAPAADRATTTAAAAHAPRTPAPPFATLDDLGRAFVVGVAAGDESGLAAMLPTSAALAQVATCDWAPWDLDAERHRLDFYDTPRDATFARAEDVRGHDITQAASYDQCAPPRPVRVEVVRVHATGGESWLIEAARLPDGWWLVKGTR